MNTVIRGGAIVTCDARHSVLAGDVAIRGREIVAVGPDAASRVEPPHRIIDARGCVVMPGFVQTHIHLVQTLFRGLADDVPLLTWLRRYIWPLEAAHDEQSLATSAELGLAELLLSGTTCILDMGTTHGHEVVLEACERSGIRAFSGKAMMDTGDGVPKGLAEGTKSSLRVAERQAKAWEGRGEGRIRYAFAPRFILSCSEGLLRETAQMAASMGALLHTHAAEQVEERDVVRKARGADDIELLASYGFKGDRTVLAHGVQLRDDEIERLAREQTRVTHCPSSNLKLGSGIARVHEMRKAGVVVGLGADGAPCNNNLDGWVEMRLAALLSKVRAGTTTMPARDVLRMATIDGAKALGIDALVGSIEAGKRADLAVVSIEGLHVAPAVDLMSTLVYGSQSRDVRHVLVDGKQLVEDGKLVGVDQQALSRKATSDALRIARKAGVL